MITPSEIKNKAENKYNQFLQSIVEGLPFSPIIIAGNKKPDDDIMMFNNELTDLINQSKEKKGYGYSIEYQTVKTKKHGLQDIPSSICFPTEQDYLKYINRVKETANFRTNMSSILSSFPELKDWIYKYPMKVIENDWDSLLKVCSYFKKEPTPQLYIRELPIRVHTKFIERKKGIIKELLDIIIPNYVNADENHFETRFHLKYDEPTVRFRILDKNICKQYFSDVEDLSIPISQFQELNLPISSVYIVENKINMLTFPSKEKSIIVWGHGFGVDIMREVKWLNNVKIYYWGDLDTHGFQILSEIRSHFNHVVSFLMDKETFDTFYEGDMGSETNVEKILNLTHEENEMFLYLKKNNFRLEQEKIPHEYAIINIP